ncbi:MAG: DNA polymerase III subunit beta [Candidatus Schekmanbacteria bacterium]|nr:DNA polymerase III subunit beta [Candidatus Schekmanbacteria bacterium]
MELKIQRNEFLKSLQRCQGVVPAKGTMSILAYLLIKTVPNGIEVAATDLELSIRSFSQAQIVSEGQITLLAKKIFEIVRELPEEEIHLVKQSNNMIKIICGKSDFTIGTLPAEDFPILPIYADHELETFDAVVLAEGIRKTIFAVPSGDPRYSMNGMLLELGAQQLAMVATDGHRLSYFKRSLGTENPERKINVILPKKFLLELRRLLEEGISELKMVLQEKQAIFKTAEVILTGRLIEGVFPNYHQAIPPADAGLTHVKVKKPDYVHALRRVVLLSDEKARGVKMQLRWGQIHLCSQESELGDAEETIETDYRGEELTLGFNADYLLEILSVIDEEELDLGISGGLGPCVITPVNNPDYLCIIMPLRVD